MRPIDIVALILRVLAVVWFVYCLGQVQQWFHASQALAGRVPAFWWLLALQVLGCVILWFFPRSIARTLQPALAQTQVEAAPSWGQWQILTLIALGLWLLTRAIPDAVYWLTLHSLLNQSNRVWDVLQPDQKAGMVATVVELGLGVWLLFGAQGFAAFLFRARTARLGASAEADAA